MIDHSMAERVLPRRLVKVPVKQLCYVKELFKLQCMFFVLQCFVDEIFQFDLFSFCQIVASHFAERVVLEYQLIVFCMENIIPFIFQSFSSQKTTVDKI